MDRNGRVVCMCCAAQKALPGVKARSEGAEMSSVVDRAVREFLDRQSL